MFSSFSLTAILVLFVIAGAVVFVCGLRMTSLADRIADRTGLGEALIGGVMLGAATSLSGLTVTFTAALGGDASLAFANGVGGIAAQTAFLGVADLIYRRVNLEHAAAQLENLFQGVLLFMLLTIPFVIFTGPDYAVLGMHPGSFLLAAAYGYGLYMTKVVRDQPMWRAVSTRQSREDAPEDAADADASPWPLIGGFVALAAVLGVAGWTIAQTGGVLSDRLGLSATLVGALLTAVVTSLPELVTTVMAVRRGALQLAVGGIIGGNMFDTLFITVADAGYRDGSIYHALDTPDMFWLATGLLMTALLIIGMLYRQKSGPAGIGIETLCMLLVYAGAVVVQAGLG